MVFISVVPDSYYFLWQIELQLHNFRQFGIEPKNIHILVGADKTYGLSLWFKEFVEEHADKASFFVYPRTKDEFSYTPSVRPNLLKQHFGNYPALEKEVIFYHDSDIVFRALPDFDQLSSGDEWWVADCRSYMDSAYLKRNDEETFYGMCSLLNIDPTVVEANDVNAGGAQYILKGMNAGFWAQMEEDCEQMFRYLNRNTVGHVPATVLAAGDHQSGIQAWCTDMWVLFWSALKQGKKVRISAELDFSWAADPIARYNDHKIFHNSGVTSKINADNKMIFAKTEFTTHSPFFFRQDLYSQDYCAHEYVKLIRELEATRNKIDLTDVTFLIPLFIDSADRLINLEITCRYLHKHFNTHIIIVEAGAEPKVKDWMLPPNASYHFVEDRSPYFHRTKYNNLLISHSKTAFVSLYDVDVILPPEQIVESITVLRKGEYHITYPYSGLFYSTNGLVKDIFRMMLDHRVLLNFKETHALGAKRSLGGCVFLEKATFIENGGENEQLTSWGPDDLERAARYKILGYKIHRTAGGLYHLPHERGLNSGYTRETQSKLMLEYLNICSRSKEELIDYIQTWNFFSN